MWHRSRRRLAAGALALALALGLLGWSFSPSMAEGRPSIGVPVADPGGGTGGGGG